MTYAQPSQRRARGGGVQAVRILILDDDEEAIARCNARLAPELLVFEHRSWRTEIHVVRVVVEAHANGEARIAASVIDEIARICAQPLDVIVSDYGFATSPLLDLLEQRDKAGEPVSESEVLGSLLTLPDLVAAIKARCDGPEPTRAEANLQKHFLEHERSVHLYSYTSRELMQKMHPVPSRLARTQRACPAPHIVAHDLKHEFYNGPEFDWPNPSKKDRLFHAHLLSGFVKQHVAAAFLERVLEDAKRLKYLRGQRSVFAVALIVVIGGSVGAVADWLGGHILSLWQTGLTGAAFAMAGLTIVFLLVVGLSVPLIFERLMSALVRDEFEERR